jgi:hypothetical protein
MLPRTPSSDPTTQAVQGFGSLAVGCDYQWMAWEWLAPVVTGGVGVAGIVGAVWGATRGGQTQITLAHVQAEAEFKRRFFADRRELYAKVLHCLEDLADSAIELELRQKHHDRCKAAQSELPKSDLLSASRAEDVDRASEEAGIALLQYRATVVATRRLRSELAIVAGQEMADKLQLVSVATLKIVRDSQIEEYHHSLLALTQAMHDDLSQFDVTRSVLTP